MGFKDLREFIDAADRFGDVERIDGADWNLEIGAITEVAASSPRCPMMLFDRIEGYRPGFRIVSNLLHTERRLALALGGEPDLKGVALLARWKDAIGAVESGPAPLEVKHGPVTQNVITGEEVDIFKFPAVKWHELDGGRYMAGSIAVMKDPDSGWVNLGIYRLQAHDRNTFNVMIEPGKHGKLIREKYWARGHGCPVAICLGQTPVLFLAATMFAPANVSEYRIGGLINGGPIEVLAAPHTGLPVPATAEVVMEGEIPPPEVESQVEGPFGEATGYYASSPSPEPVVKVRSIMHRNDPIIQGAPPMRPLPGLWHFPMNFRAATLWNDLQKCGIPEIRGVWQQGYGMMVVSLKQMYAGHAKQALLVAAGSRSAHIIRFIVVVDEDIDPTNIHEVTWAIGTRCDPERDIDIIRDGYSGPIDPMPTREQREIGDWTTGKVLLNACRPTFRRREFAPVVAISPELREQVMRKWGKHLE